jgi:hypothetical protein
MIAGCLSLLRHLLPSSTSCAWSLRHISPLIWRRVLVRSGTTVADLHVMLQTVSGWSNEHLHCFVIQGRRYGNGGRADQGRVWLSDLGLRVGERWLYEYDFSDGWQHDIRLEQIWSLEPRRQYPVCIGGQRTAHPKIVAASGPSWSCSSTTRRPASLHGC